MSNTQPDPAQEPTPNDPADASDVPTLHRATTIRSPRLPASVPSCRRLGSGRSERRRTLELRRSSRVSASSTSPIRNVLCVRLEKLLAVKCSASSGPNVADAFRVAAAGRGLDVDEVIDGINLAKFVGEDGTPDRDAVAAFVDRIAPERETGPAGSRSGRPRWRPAGTGPEQLAAAEGPRTGARHPLTASPPDPSTGGHHGDHRPTKTSDLSGFITPAEAAPIFERAARTSVVQQLSPQVPLGPSGVKIPVISTRPTAAWVGEGEQKPASAGSITPKTIEPKKLASIFVVSAEVARLNPAQFVTRMHGSFAETFAVAFDLAALHDVGPDGSAGAGLFSTYVAQTTKTQEIGATAQNAGGVYGDLNAALGKVVSGKDASGRRYRVTGWALDDVVEPAIRGAVDTAGRPIWADLASEQESDLFTSGRLLGRRGFFGEGVATPT